MKIILITVLILIASSFVLLFLLGKYSQKGQAPGLVDSGLSKCPKKPNCVCSEHPDDLSHYIEAINIELRTNSTLDAMSLAVSTIEGMNGIVSSTEENYLAASFTSRVFGFVDDFEIRLDPNQGSMHIRSASRVGYGDGGVNKKRVEMFKQLFKQASGNILEK